MFRVLYVIANVHNFPREKVNSVWFSYDDKTIFRITSLRDQFLGTFLSKYKKREVGALDGKNANVSASLTFSMLMLQF